MSIEIRRYRSRFSDNEVVATKFTTNNENGSPTMDAIVNWANQGSTVCRAWHNGTDIFWYGEHAYVGDWLLKLDGGLGGSVCSGMARPAQRTFDEIYDPVEEAQNG